MDAPLTSARPQTRPEGLMSQEPDTASPPADVRPQVRGPNYRGGMGLTFTVEELKDIERVVHAEAGNQGVEGRNAVRGVIFNRLASDRFPNNLNDVMMKPGSFEPVDTAGHYKNLPITDELLQSGLAEMREYIAGGEDASKGNTFFQALDLTTERGTNFPVGDDAIKIGDHTFSNKNNNKYPPVDPSNHVNSHNVQIIDDADTPIQVAAGFNKGGSVVAQAEDVDSLMSYNKDMGGISQEDAEAAGFSPQTINQIPSNRETSTEGYTQQVSPLEPTVRNKVEDMAANVFTAMGMSDDAARRAAVGFVGDPSNANMVESMGVLDWTPAGAVFAVDEAVDAFNTSKTATDKALNVGVGLLSAAEAIPLAGQGAKAVNKGITAAKPFVKDMSNWLADNVNKFEIDPTAVSQGGVGAIKKKSLVEPNAAPNTINQQGDVSSVDLPHGNDPRYRGKAPNRTEPYLRYRPKKTTARMDRLSAAIADENNPINKLFDNYVLKGQTLDGDDWYNTEELRDWMVSRLGEKEGDLRWREYIELVGAGSTGAKVPENIRISSFYNALSEKDRIAVASMVKEGGITPLAAAKKLGVEPANAPTDYNYGHVMQGNHARNALNHTEGEWDRKMPEGLTKGQQTEWLKSNPKVKGFGNDLLGDETNIAADLHFMRMLAMADGGGDFLGKKASLSVENLEIVKSIIGPRKIKKYMNSRMVKGKPVTEINLYKAWQDGHIKDTTELQKIPTVWAEAPEGNEYAAYEDMANAVAKRYDMTPAQFQANLWMGAGEITNLADASQGTFMDLFRRALDKRGAERGISRSEMLKDFIDNRAVLQVPLAGGAATGAGLMAQDDQPAPKAFALGGLSVADGKKGIMTPEGDEIADKKFQLEPKETDGNGDGKSTAYEKIQGEAKQKVEESLGMNKGGSVMSEDKDPVSGNVIPLGSKAENVRDDIPAMLSEDEYVLPAHVVKYHGLKTIQDMQKEAEKGLMEMQDAGLFGGQELDDDKPSDTDEAKPKKAKSTLPSVKKSKKIAFLSTQELNGQTRKKRPPESTIL